MAFYHDEKIADVIKPDDNWKPLYWTDAKNKNTSFADAICDFIEKFCIPTLEGQVQGFYLRPWQRWLIRHIFELDSFGLFRYKTVFIMIPRKNGKSFLMSSILTYFITKARNGDQLYTVAKSAKQARVVFEEVAKNIYSSKILGKITRPLKNEILHKTKTAVLKPLSGNAGQAQGLNPYITVGDEIHVWDSSTGTSSYAEDMWTAITTGSSNRQESMFIAITTAGTNLNGLAYGKYQYGVQVATGVIQDDAFGFFCWQAEDDDDISSIDTWKKANPNLAEGLLELSVLQKEYNQASQISTTEFERFYLNKWIRLGDKQLFISEYNWKQAMDKKLGKIPLGSEITVGFDGSLTEDSTGIVAIDIKTGLIEVLYAWEKDINNADWFVDPQDVEEKMEKVFNNYKVVKLYADPSRYKTFVQIWAKRYGRNIIRDIPPSNQRMAPMSSDFRQDIYTKTLHHVGEERLSKHVMNAIINEREVPMKQTRNSPHKIDLLMCAVLANGARREYIEKQEAIQRNKAFYTN